MFPSLTTAIRDIEEWLSTAVDHSLTDSEQRELCNLGNRLGYLASKINSTASQSKQSARQVSQEMLSQARVSVQKLFDMNDLRPSNFNRNITTIFGSPKATASLTPAAKRGVELCKERCERLRKLSADGIVTWAISYKSAEWTARLKKDVFDSLVSTIEPTEIQHWSAVVGKNLEALRNGSLGNNKEYNEFVEGEITWAAICKPPTNAFICHSPQKPRSS